MEAASDGLLNREIGERLGYSPRTVEGLIEETRIWLDARNRPHAVARAIMAGLIPPRDPRALALLSSRQLELATVVAQGRTAAEAARVLGISEHTVVAHLRRARRVTGCRTSAGLAALVASLERSARGRPPGGGTAPAPDVREGYRLLLALLEQGRVEDALDWLRQVVPPHGRVRLG